MFNILLGAIAPTTNNMIACAVAGVVGGSALTLGVQRVKNLKARANGNTASPADLERDLHVMVERELAKRKAAENQARVVDMTGATT